MEVTKSDIQKLIQVQKNNTFLNHFICSIKKDYKIYGNIEKHKIIIWQRTSWTGSSYSLYSFEFDSEGILTKVNDKLNPFAQYSQLLFPLFFFFPLLSTAFTDFQIKKFLACISVFLFLTFACYLFSRRIGLVNKKDQLTDFYQLINIKANNKQLVKQHKSRILDLETEEKLENEWSSGKILTRLFTYPFCLALIFLSIFGMIPDGKFFIAIPILAIVSVYLYSDLMMIFKQNK
ncbi:hypothetical protein [Flavobacterium sharifuzzamanii]|uniref:hypothetical protein n=1 Tax=Flavobacterium sharifuzzamanii TaxID=2211133 RepID=UPI000DAE8223|nr:hypothetical protein [Flavobacterium sharifuzzamanii]KAF2081332.1 hypothetical protein DMA14_10045 [Flavobacterium sharifuzzamanii]